MHPTHQFTACAGVGNDDGFIVDFVKMMKPEISRLRASFCPLSIDDGGSFASVSLWRCWSDPAAYP